MEFVLLRANFQDLPQFSSSGKGSPAVGGSKLALPYSGLGADHQDNPLLLRRRAPWDFTPPSPPTRFPLLLDLETPMPGTNMAELRLGHKLLVRRWWAIKGTLVISSLLLMLEGSSS
jgi:hypothetical protein